ncbi:MAG: permease [Sulfobacillus acidophilus]|uniref:Permease n=1 Tax=Sulfobacillus acidophilus TaxID=53633 RepID=A0A2T2WFZ6_9FIRM|nr:MAG: permease [Sulfobacillus acidophilus]
MAVSQRSVTPGKNYRGAAAIFVVIAVVGVFYAKWYPYYLKTFVTASTHTLGPSFIIGANGHPPAVGWMAAWTFFLGYFKDIWIALIVGILVGAGLQTLLPASWLYRMMGRVGVKSRALAIAAAVPSMMCTCCSSPVVVSMKKQNLSTGATLGYWLANPVLNPATIIFMGFVLGWDWALLRIVMGFVLVIGVSWAGDGWMNKSTASGIAEVAHVDAPVDEAPTFKRFALTVGKLVVRLIPEYVIIVAVLGAVRLWLFPTMNPHLGHSLWLMLVFAVVGTLFVIPTAGEIPIVQTLLTYGLGLGSAGVLMMTLPAVSLPSMAMVSKQLARKDLLKVAVMVALAGLVTGLLAMWLL